jgi:hypothetical protein
MGVGESQLFPVFSNGIVEILIYGEFDDGQRY